MLDKTSSPRGRARRQKTEQNFTTFYILHPSTQGRFIVDRASILKLLARERDHKIKNEPLFC